jgi:hypothetical protein
LAFPLVKSPNGVTPAGPPELCLTDSRLFHLYKVN